MDILRLERVTPLALLVGPGPMGGPVRGCLWRFGLVRFARDRAPSAPTVRGCSARLQLHPRLVSLVGNNLPIRCVNGLFPCKSKVYLLRGLIDQGRRRGKRTGRFLLLGSASIDLLRQSGETL